MKTFLCKMCGNCVEVENGVSEVWCANQDCQGGATLLMDEVYGNQALNLFKGGAMKNERRKRRTSTRI